MVHVNIIYITKLICIENLVRLLWGYSLFFVPYNNMGDFLCLESSLISKWLAISFHSLFMVPILMYSYCSIDSWYICVKWQKLCKNTTIRTHFIWYFLLTEIQFSRTVKYQINQNAGSTQHIEHGRCRARSIDVRKQNRTGRGYEIFGIHARIVRCHIFGGRYTRARLCSQGVFL